MGKEALRIVILAIFTYDYRLLLEYVLGNSFKKSTIANIIVNDIQSLVPSGSFLKKTKGSTKSSSKKEAWQVIGEEAMIATTKQALRVGANKIKNQRNAMRRAFATTQVISMNEVPASTFSLSTHQ